MATTEVFDFERFEDERIEIQLAQERLKLIQTLSDEQVVEIRTAFQHFDKDKSGTISTKELGSLFKALGQNLSDEELLQIIIRVDVDHDGVLDFAEFLHLMACLLSDSKTEEETAECFRVFDDERLGKVEVEDFKAQLRAIYLIHGTPDAEVAELFENLGLNDVNPGETLNEPELTISRNSAASNTVLEEQATTSFSQPQRYVTLRHFQQWLRAPSANNEKGKK